MEIVSRMKRTIAPRPRQESKQKLNVYLISQVFTQLISFQQLLLSMGEFIGKGRLFRSDILLDAVRLSLDHIIQSMTYSRYDFDTQLGRIQGGLEELKVVGAEIRIKSMYPRLIKLDLVINSPPNEMTLMSIQTLLESTLHEPLRLIAEKPKGKQTRIKVYSSNLYKVRSGVNYVGKDGDKLSGDSYICEDLASGQTLMAISDGMGNGLAAHKESSEALKIIKSLLSLNVKPEKAIETLQHLKQYSNTDERFFSLDLCMIDRERKRATFYKKGATPTFIIRGRSIEMIQISQLPVGVMTDDNEHESRTIHIEENDVIVMCSDGIFEQYHNIDELQACILSQLGKSPKLMAKNILQNTVTKHKGKIKDDMLVLTAAYTRQEPKQIKTA